MDVLAARVSLACSGCGAAPKQRDKKLLERLGEVWRLRALPASSGEAQHRDATGRVNLDEMDIGPDLVARVPASVALAYRCVPIRYENEVLTVALADFVREGVLEDLAFVLRCTVHGVASPCSAIERELGRLYGSEGAPPPA